MKDIKKYRKTAALAGILLVIAMVANLFGRSLLEIVQPEPNHSSYATGIILEIVNAFAVLGIGILLYPILKDFQKKVAQTYLLPQLMEAIVWLAVTLVLVALLNSSELRMFFTGKLIPLFFCCAAIVLYSVLFLHCLLPRFISPWGFIGVAGIIVLTLADFESSAGMLLALLIILNEIFLSIWLIVKGFNKTKELYVSKI